MGKQRMGQLEGFPCRNLREIFPIKTVLRYVLAIGFAIAGIMHFVLTQFYVRIVPPPFDAHAQLLVYLSGVCEIVGGVAVLFPQTRRAAGIGLLAFLVAVFPANLYMAMRPELFRDVATPNTLLLRLPLQLVLMAWVWFCCL